ncbi:MAG TPA: carboxypeptidase-like regulatory domain-containing protein [Pyrinomonadaceae bacterium]|nr:carboxypeptidase-like regulatory domain-containing protein [Pyrinomonadaceae bacterium]
MRLFIVLIALCVAVQGQEPSSAPKSTDESARGTISGRVVNENGQPVAGATTAVRRTHSVFSGRTTATDAEGNFSVTNLERGLYSVTVSAPAHISIPPDPNDPSTYYRIGDSVNLRLVRGGVITGTVTNAQGEPVIAVNVRVTMVRDSNGKAPAMPFLGLMQQPTDDRGIYRIFGLLPGTYLVSAGGVGLMQTFGFNPYDFDVPTYAPSSTRDTAAEVTVTSGEETNVDIRYRGEPGYIISGTVKVAASTNGATVSLTPVAGNLMSSGNAYQPPGGGGRGFAFHGVADGEYDLVAQEFSQAQIGTTTIPGFMLSEPKRITIKGASVTGIEITTKPLGSVSGQIVLESSKAPECQGKRPPLLAETLIQLRRPEKDTEKDKMPYLRVFASTGSPDAKGAFVLKNLYAGKYQFEPKFYARYWYFQSITIGAAPPATATKSQPASSKTDAAANWTIVKFGEKVANLTITLAEGAAAVRGKLEGEPAPGMVLHLVPSEQDKAADVLRFFVTEVGADGTFALNNLPPGRYWAVTQTNADAQTATLTKLREPEAATARTKLRKTAEARKTEIELKPCQNITDYQLKQ